MDQELISQLRPIRHALEDLYAQLDDIDPKYNPITSSLASAIANARRIADDLIYIHTHDLER